MRARIEKWGHGVALRIPKTLAKKAGLMAGSAVYLQVESGRLEVWVRPPLKYSLTSLLKRVTPGNRHPEFDWGPPVGREVW